MSLAAYELREVIHEGPHVVVSRGRRVCDGLSVVVKRPRNLGTAAARLRHEQSIFHSITLSPGGPNAYVLECIDTDTELATVFEDIGGESLAVICDLRGLSIDETLSVGIQLTEALDGLHRQHVMHKHVGPENVVYNPTTGRVQLIDLSDASMRLIEAQTCVNVNGLTGNLHTMAPEQTGYLRRTLDLRADLYSLGATLYYLLSGTSHVRGSTRFEQACSLVSKAPEPLGASIPLPLNQTIMMLLARAPEHRFQSAAALHLHLTQLRGGLTPSLPNASPQAPFVAENLANLQSLYQHISRGERRQASIAGGTDAQRADIVDSVRPWALRDHALMLTGTHSQSWRYIPFYGLSQAVAQWLSYIDLEPPDARERWMRRIRQAVGDMGALLADSIPALGLLLGKCPSLPAATFSQFENRQHLMWQRLLSVMADLCPLILALENMQWADSGTLRIIDRVIHDTSPRKYGILLITTTGESTVDPVLESAAGSPSGLEFAEAGFMCMQALAYREARELLRVSLHKHENEAWSYKATRDIETAAMECGLLGNCGAEAEAELKHLVANAQTDEDRAEVHRCYGDALIALQRPKEAVQVIAQGLQYLGVHAADTFLSTVSLLLRLGIFIAFQSWDKILRKPWKAPARVATIARCYATLMSATFVARDPRYLTTALRLAEFLVIYGNSPLLYLAYLAFANLLWRRNFHTAAKRVLDAGVEITSRDRTDAVAHVRMLMARLFHYGLLTTQMTDSSDSLFYLYRRALELGDISTASYTALMDYSIITFLSCDLERQRDAIYRPYFANYAVPDQRQAFESLRAAHHGLQEAVPSTMGAYTDFLRSNVPQGKLSFMGALTIVELAKFFLLAQQIAAAYDCVIRAAGNGILNITVQHTYAVFAPIVLLEHARANHLRRISERRLFATCMRRVLTYSHVPDSFYRGPATFLKAHIADFEGRPARAMPLYEQAIIHFDHMGARLFAAMARESAGRFYLRQEQPAKGKDLLQESHDGFMKIAPLHAHLLREEFPEIDALRAQHTFDSPWFTPVALQEAEHTDDMSTIQDLAVRALGDALVHERNAGRLAHRLTSAMVNHTGATRSILLTHQRGTFNIVAQSPLNQRGCPLSREALFATVRTNAPVILRTDHSILSIPLRHKGGLLGVIYAENAQTTHAFDEAQIRRATYLARQASLALAHIAIPTS